MGRVTCISIKTDSFYDLNFYYRKTWDGFHLRGLTRISADQEINPLLLFALMIIIAKYIATYIICNIRDDASHLCDASQLHQLEFLHA